MTAINSTPPPHTHEEAQVEFKKLTNPKSYNDLKSAHSIINSIEALSTYFTQNGYDLSKRYNQKNVTLRQQQNKENKRTIAPLSNHLNFLLLYTNRMLKLTSVVVAALKNANLGIFAM